MAHSDQTIGTVELHLYGHLRESTGKPCLRVHWIAGETVRGLLRRLARLYDKRFAEYEGGPAQEPTVAVMLLNGRTLRIPQDLNCELEPGDSLHLIPPIAGG